MYQQLLDECWYFQWACENDIYIPQHSKSNCQLQNVFNAAVCWAA